jgi:hypothetical protein
MSTITLTVRIRPAGRRGFAALLMNEHEATVTRIYARSELAVACDAARLAREEGAEIIHAQ